MARVDHYVGYPITALAVPNKNATWKFQLLLEGGTAVRFYDSEAPKESEVAGNFIMAVTNHADGSVDVIVGRNMTHNRPPEQTAMVKAKQGSYSIISEDEPDIEWFPTQVDGPATIPPPDPERTQEGPDESYWVLRAEAPRDAESAPDASEAPEPVLDPDEAQNG